MLINVVLGPSVNTIGSVPMGKPVVVVTVGMSVSGPKRTTHVKPISEQTQTMSIGQLPSQTLKGATGTAEDNRVGSTGALSCLVNIPAQGTSAASRGDVVNNHVTRGWVDSKLSS